MQERKSEDELWPPEAQKPQIRSKWERKWKSLDFPQLTLSCHLLNMTHGGAAHAVNSPNNYGCHGKIVFCKYKGVNWVQVGLSPSKSLNLHRSYPPHSLWKTIHLKILLDLTPYHSIMHRALLIITLQGHLVFQLGTRLHESGNALGSAGILNLLLPSSFLSFLPPRTKQKQVYLHTFISIKILHIHCPKICLPTSTLFSLK